MRSGTTLLHALVCTSGDVNRYIAESSYITSLVRTFAIALQTFDLHTRFYFPSKSALLQYHARLLHQVMADIWRHVGSPCILALKDPLMTPLFHFAAQLLPESQYLISVRDPRGVVASRLTSMRGGGHAVGEADLRQFCADYNDSYASVLNMTRHFAGRFHYLAYEALVRGEGFERLEAMGITGIRPERLWQDAITPPDTYRGHYFDSPLYGQPVSQGSVERFTEVLTGAEQALVMELCGETAQQLARHVAG